MRRLLSLAVIALAAGCGGDSSHSVGPSPTTPQASSATRIISLSGPINFGDVIVGATKDAALTISNSGNSTLTFTGISGGFADLSVSATSGTVPPGGNTSLTFRFAPTSLGARTATLGITADQTAGVNTTTINGNAVTGGPPSASGTWIGRAVGSNCTQSGPLGGVDYCRDNANIAGPMTIALVQSVTGAVTGTATFIDYKSNVSGSLNGTRLQINGTGNAGFLDYEYANWNTDIIGILMTGSFKFRFSAKNPGGFVVWDMTLSGVTRTSN